MHVPTDHFKTSYLRLRQEVPVINHIEALNHSASDRIDTKTFGLHYSTKANAFTQPIRNLALRGTSLYEKTESFLRGFELKQD